MTGVIITRDRPGQSLIQRLFELTGSDDELRTKGYLSERVLDYISLTEHRLDLPDALFAPIATRDDLDHFLKVHWALSVATRYEEHFPSFLGYLKKDAKFLGLTLNDTCDKFANPEKRCSHCVAGKGDGRSMDLARLAAVDDRFFELFQEAAFGRKGEPMLYRNGNNTLADAVQLLIEKGLQQFSFYFGVFDPNNPRYFEEYTRLVDIMQLEGVRFQAGLTYHLFAPDIVLFESGFRYAFEACFEFCDEITIDLLASEVMEETSVEALEQRFEHFKQFLFQDYGIIETEEGTFVERDNRRVKLSYKGPSDNVYDLGEFKKTLERKGLTKRYREMMGLRIPPPICVSTMNHETIVVEPDGGVKTCLSFDGIYTCAKVNLFEAGYEGVLAHLEKRFHAQREEIIARLPDIIYKRHSMCDCDVAVD